MVAVTSGFVGVGLVASVGAGLYPLGLLELELSLDWPVGVARSTQPLGRDSYGHDQPCRENASSGNLNTGVEYRKQGSFGILSGRVCMVRGWDYTKFLASKRGISILTNPPPPAYKERGSLI